MDARGVRRVVLVIPPSSGGIPTGAPKALSDGPGMLSPFPFCGVDVIF